MKKTFLVLGLIFLAGCQNSQTNISSSNNPSLVSSSSTVSNISHTNSSNFFSLENFSSQNFSNSGSENLSSKVASRQIIFLGKDKKEESAILGTQNIFLVGPNSEKKVVMQIFLTSGEKLTTKISAITDGDVVLRLSTIKNSDGETDGPFGTQNEFIAKKSGNYEFSFGLNLMASNENYNGDYKIDVLIK